MDTILTLFQKNYLQGYINSVAGFHLPLETISNELQAQIFNFISRKEESTIKHRDQWGNFEGSFSEAYLNGLVNLPWIDNILQNVIKEYLKVKPQEINTNKYPENKRFAVCITHDVDNINYFPSVRILSRAINRFFKCHNYTFKAGQLTILKTLKDRFTHNHEYMNQMDFYRFMALESQLGFKSTFYCFADSLSQPHYYDSYYSYKDQVVYHSKVMKFGEVIREIRAMGWDIGLHGSYISAFDEGILQHEKRNLEKHLQGDIISIRQHWMHFDIMQTPRIQHAQRFVSDSTLGFNRGIGFRSGVAHPHKLWDFKHNQQLDLWEIPLNLMDGALFYPNALELDADLAIRQSIRLLDRVEEAGGVLTLNWHPDHLNKPVFWTVYQTLLQEAKRRNAWGCSAAELAKHWSGYYAQVNQGQNG